MVGDKVIEQTNGRGDFGAGAIALHAAGREDDLEAGIAPADDVEDIADGRAGGRGDEADAARVGWERALALGGEKALGVELLLELFEGGLQRAESLQFHGGDAELILPARFVDGEVAAQDDFAAVLQQITRIAGFGAEEDAVQLRVGVLEREIDVAGALGAEVGDFAGDPDVADLGFEQAANLAREFGDGENAADLFRREQFAEVPL